MTKNFVDNDEMIRQYCAHGQACPAERTRQTQEQTPKQLLRDFMQRADEGFVKALVMQALGTKRSSPEDLEAIEKLLDRFEGERS